MHKNHNINFRIIANIQSLAEVSTLIQWKSPKPLKYKGFGLLCV